MSESQKFPVAAHALAYLAHKAATTSHAAISSAELAASIPTHPVVVRRVMAMLVRAGLVATRAGAGGGAWLLLPPEGITLDHVLRAVEGCAHLGVPTLGVKGCPVGERIPGAVAAALRAADEAATARLSQISVSDLLGERPAGLTSADGEAMSGHDQ